MIDCFSLPQPSLSTAGCTSTSAPSAAGAEAKNRFSIPPLKDSRVTSDATIKSPSCKAILVAGTSQATRAVVIAPTAKKKRTNPGRSSARTNSITPIVSQYRAGSSTSSPSFDAEASKVLPIHCESLCLLTSRLFSRSQTGSDIPPRRGRQTSARSR